MPDHPPVVMTIAGSDPTGGAGLQADLLTLASLGCHPVSVVTAITIQDSIGVEDVMPLDPEWVIDQARCVLEDMPVAAFKIGLLGSTEIVAGIAEVLSDYPDVPLILDPVLTSGRGDELANEDMISAIRALIIPQSTIITPNSLEARRLVEDDLDDDADLDKCALSLLESGCEYVLVTGTHEKTTQVINKLYRRDNGIVRTDKWQRLPGSFHGSGCTLASAIAALLARGMDVNDAVGDGQEFTWQTLNNAFRLGMGQHIPNRLFWAKDDVDEPEKH
ncbi:MAG TPA: bifunctional hydroxymethylpyrimidine kinase/phosphomethylpyrimidine kinase [Burkholderiales bacterium]|jgi:hydroxymethylpyrimidine/phosphomethylpyrimidine kinase|nr:bifunctional hydroxymethylpyrimidine kinase/phosphomethylpyrimidine kinase [Burkholderiales bacterium]